MAHVPCELCQRRYLGKAAYFYLTVAQGSAAERERYRICPDCRDWVLLAIDNRAQRVELEGPDVQVPFNCMFCSEFATGDGTGAVFCTAYAPERLDWYARTCTEHAHLRPRGLLDVLARTLPGPTGQ